MAHTFTIPTEEKAAAIGIVAACGLVQWIVYRCRGPGTRDADGRALPSCRMVRPMIRVVRPLVVSILFCSLFLHGPWLLVWHESRGWRWLGVAMTIGGIALFLWAMRSLGDAYSPCNAAYMPAQIVTHGAYAWLRHPIYISNAIFLFGISLATGSCWMAIPLLAFVGIHTVQAAREEKQLAEEYPEYRDYQPRIH